jgi:hypothetical protein
MTVAVGGNGNLPVVSSAFFGGFDNKSAMMAQLLLE